MLTPEETFNRAGQVADTLASYLMIENVSDALIVVFQRYMHEYPLAIRTPNGDGFGADTDMFARSSMAYLKEAMNQSRLAVTGGGRQAVDLSQRLLEKKRRVPSYSLRLPSSSNPNFALDKEADLVAVTVSPKIELTDRIALTKRAIQDVEEKKRPDQMLEASIFAQSCLEELEKDLPDQNTAVFMIGLPRFLKSKFDDSDVYPPIVFSQMGGRQLQVSNFEIVTSKLRTTAMTGYRSNIHSSLMHIDASDIPGAIPVKVKDKGERIFAAGGLLDGEEDVEAILTTLNRTYADQSVLMIHELSRL